MPNPMEAAARRAIPRRWFRAGAGPWAPSMAQPGVGCTLSPFVRTRALRPPPSRAYSLGTATLVWSVLARSARR
jgi:hypothetical protein